MLELFESFLKYPKKTIISVLVALGILFICIGSSGIEDNTNKDKPEKRNTPLIVVGILFIIIGLVIAGLVWKYF